MENDLLLLYYEYFDIQNDQDNHCVIEQQIHQYIKTNEQKHI